MKTYNGIHGHTYYYVTQPNGNKILMACPTNLDNTGDYESELAVEDFCEPLTKAEIKKIVNKLI